MCGLQNHSCGRLLCNVFLLKSIAKPCLASAASFWYGERIELLWIPPLAVALGSYFMLRIPTSAAKTR